MHRVLVSGLSNLWAAVLLVAAIGSSTAWGVEGGAPAVESFEPIAGEVLIGFHRPPTDETLAALAAAVPEFAGWLPPYPYPGDGGNNAPNNAGANKATLRHQPAAPLVVPVHPLAVRRKMQIDPNADVTAVAARVASLAGVEWASPNGVTRPALEPNDTLYGQQYGPQIIGAPAAWDVTPGGGSGIILAVADSGQNFEHEDFGDAAFFINHGEIPGNNIDDDLNGFIDDWRGWDFMNRDNLPTASSSHGTHVAGIAAARLNNATGIAGLAGRVAIMPLQVFNGGGGTWEAIELAVIYATDNGASVLNYSGGGGGGTPGLALAVQYAADNGVSVVAAAGNGNTSTPFYPAAYPSVLAITGTDRNDARYGSSNYGNWVDVAAPGVSVYSSLWPGVNAYGNLTGTSMSSPHAAGLVALMFSVNADLTPEDVRQRLRDNAVDLGTPGFDPYFGYGRIDAAATLTDVWQNGGCGNLDDLSATVNRGTIKATARTHDVAGGRVKVECTGAGGTLSKAKPVKPSGVAKLKLKGAAAGAYTCSVVRLEDANGDPLCDGHFRPVAAIVD